ncbi:hypothetical protein PSA85_05950 [Limosilactobacillus reuteri]|uniref:hypothetical protein n=1 Tax=Limosilactobacillus reuteri TaxID=1598 RepID=UPI002363009E|nr:hypothetical protein [Limosilactobacillus reuteri]MDD1406901.1 hypothetical protein [Limosilactobacillus reuteri]
MVEDLKDAIANNSKPTTIYYCYDDSGKPVKPAFVVDGEQPPANSTKIPPVKKLSNGMIASLQNPTFDKANQEWIEHPTQQPATPEVKLVAQLGQQVAMIDLNNHNINRKIDMQTKLINDLAQSLIKEQGGK